MKKDFDKFAGAFYIPYDVETDINYGITADSWSLELYHARAQRVYIKKVIYNQPATIVFWSDGTKTVSKCSPADEYVRETGLAVCILKKLTSPSQVRNLFDDWVTYRSNEVSLADVRRNHK